MRNDAAPADAVCLRGDAGVASRAAAGPIRAEPSRAEPIRAETIRAGAIGAGAIGAGAIQIGTVQAGAAQAGSIQTGAVQAGAAQTGAAQAGAIHAGAIPAGAVQAGPVRVAAMTPAHAEQVLAIYQAGIDEGNATFEISAPAWAEFSAARLPGHRFVAIDAAADGVLGWVAVSATSSRPVYAGVVEHSVYVHPAARGRGVGRLLLGALIDSTESAGIWTIQSGIFPENAASIALHRSAGFRVVGTRERIARHHGRWRDILLIERRSPRV